MSLGSPYEVGLFENVRFTPAGGLAARVWQRDSSAWGPGEDDPVDRLGWLDLPRTVAPAVNDVSAFVESMRGRLDAVVLLGMGGSSLAPEVFFKTFGRRPGYPALHVVDSTHPGHVRSVTESLEGRRCLFLVSSKSGGTVETMSLYRHFRSLRDDGQGFVAITDPATSLAELAEREGFAQTFLNPPDIGGRFSALSFFGLVPAALVGVDIATVLERATTMMDACSADASEEHNPGLVLGSALAHLASQGRDKLTFLVSPDFTSLGAWLEQLIAESTGKHGKGVVPVADEPCPEGALYGDDRVFCYIGPGGDAPEQLADRLAAQGHPVIRLTLRAREDLGAEMYRWEFATAVAGALLEINAFDQPNVESAKRASRSLLEADETGEWPDDDPDALFARTAVPELAALLAFAAPTARNEEIMAAARTKVLLRYGVATTAGFGPRYLHSTGQLHKGGPGYVKALVVLDPPSADVPIPGSPYGFARLITAQAGGDAAALEAAGRQVARTTWESFTRWALAG